MRKSLAISAVAHTVALLWGLITFNALPFERAGAESVPVDFISAEDFSKLTKGSKDAPKVDNAKVKVDKIAEQKPVPDQAQKITEKQEITTASTEPPPVPETKKPDPKAKPEPKAEAKPEKPETIEPKADPIAEALKKDDARKKETEQKQADARPAPLPPKRPAPPQPKFDSARIAALLDKRDPQRHAYTGEMVNQTASLGAPSGNSPQLSQSEMDGLRARLQKNWSPPVGIMQASGMIINFRIRLDRNRHLIGPPEVTTRGSGTMFEAARDAGLRAIHQSQPFDMLRVETYETWRDFEITFDPRDMFRG